MLYTIFALISLMASGVLWYFYSQENSLSLNLTYLILAISTLVLAVIIVFIYVITLKQKHIKKLKQQLEVWSDTTYHINAAGDMAFQSLPVGIIIYDNDFHIKWFNDYAQKCLKKSLKNVAIEDISEKLLDFLKSDESRFILSDNGKTYEFSIKKENRLLYFFDTTRETDLKTKYLNRNIAIGIVVIDNLEESLKRYDLQDKTTISGQIFGEISNWAQTYNCFFQSIDDDRILIITDREELLKMVEDKFSILDNIRNLSKDNHIKTTISVGIASYDLKFNEVGDLALNAVELAEKRGGDQAVVNIQGSKIQYIGGQVNALEKNTLVAVRMQTNSLKELTDTYEKVLIMAHNKADCDALGAIIGAFRLVESFGITTRIALDYERLDVTAKKAYELLVNEEPELLDYIMDETKSLNYLNSNTLLLVCDTQSPNLVMFETLIDKALHVAVIDHHRVGDVDFKNVEMSYVETYSSSTVELIMEMFMFAPSPKLKPIEATLMLCGMVVDTNYFTYRTGFRTFEVASTLKENGADMVKVKRILRDSYSDERKISEAVVASEIVLGHFAIASIDKVFDDRTILAKISDRLLTIEGVDASFTLAYLSENEVAISSRSLDTVNVQIIMEEMGGGGHLQAAACQIKDKTLAEVKAQLLDILKRNYDFEGEERMKVILLKDVKGKGKKDDVIDVNNGYGNFLINNGSALLCNDVNLQQLEENKKQEAIDKENRRNLLLKLKQEIETKSVTVYIKQGADGKLFGHVTSKQIVDEFDAQNGIRLDKRKLEMPADINAIGIYQGIVNLDKDIQATFQINVVGC